MEPDRRGRKPDKETDLSRLSLPLFSRIPDYRGDAEEDWTIGAPPSLEEPWLPFPDPDETPVSKDDVPSREGDRHEVQNDCSRSSARTPGDAQSAAQGTDLASDAGTSRQ